MKGQELKLHVETVTPVAQPLRHIPFNLCPAIDRQIYELIDATIFEAVPDSPSTWLSPLVVVHEPDGDVRVCIDKRKVNQSIRQEQYPVISTDKLLSELNGSKVFNKLDLKWGFHQIPLAEDSQAYSSHSVD